MQHNFAFSFQNVRDRLSLHHGNQSHRWTLLDHCSHFLAIKIGLSEHKLKQRASNLTFLLLSFLCEWEVTCLPLIYSFAINSTPSSSVNIVLLIEPGQAGGRGEERKSAALHLCLYLYIAICIRMFPYLISPLDWRVFERQPTSDNHITPSSIISHLSRRLSRADFPSSALSLSLNIIIYWNILDASPLCTFRKLSKYRIDPVVQQ